MNPIQKSEGSRLKKVIITGATGFIGSWLVKECLEQQMEVLALVRDTDKAQSILPKQDGLKLISYESNEYKALMNSDSTIDVFFHLAWGGVSTELKNQWELQLDNIRFALEMIEYSKKINTKRFVGIGTVAEYAFCENIMDLNAKQTPSDMYGAAKTATHYLLETRARLIGMPFNWAVIPSTFGEGRKDSNIITYTITSLLKGERPSYGYLEQMWDFLYVKEVVRALCLIGEKGIPSKTYGIGSGVFKPLKDYMIAIRDIVNQDIELGIGDKPELSEKTFSSCVNTYDLLKDTGFIPQISFEEGICKSIPYYYDLVRAQHE